MSPDSPLLMVQALLAASTAAEAYLLELPAMHALLAALGLRLANEDVFGPQAWTLIDRQPQLAVTHLAGALVAASVCLRHARNTERQLATLPRRGDQPHHELKRTALWLVRT